MKKLAAFKTPKAAVAGRGVVFGPGPAPAPKARPAAAEGGARAFVKDELHESRLRRAAAHERVNVYLPPELAHAMRIAAVTDRRSLSDVFTEAAEEWIQRRRAG